MKKITTLLLTLAIFAGISLTALAVDYGEEYQDLPAPQITQKFSDVPSTHWAFKFIGEMAQRDILSGYPDGRFIPENQITRAEFAKIMVCAAGIRVENKNITSFTDVYTSDWYCPYVECAKDYLTGYSTSTGTVYKPTTPALREDIAVALVKLKGYDVSVADESILNMFTDSHSISSSARKYVAVAVERGIVSGYEDNTFRGQATITRAEAATLLWRAFQYGNDNKITDTTTQPPATTPPVTTPPVTTPPVTKPPVTQPVIQGSTPIITPNTTIQPTPEPEETKKPYVMKKLASANLGNITGMTLDNDNDLFYADSEDNCIYKISVPDGNKVKYLSTSKLEFEKTKEQETEEAEEITETIVNEETGEEEEVTKTVTTSKTEEVVVAEYSSYVPTQVFYDEINDKLLLIGYYSQIEEAFNTPQEGNYVVIYDITGGNAEMYCEVGNYKNFVFQTSLNDEKAVAGYEKYYSGSKYTTVSLNLNNGNITILNMFGNVLGFLKCDNDLYTYYTDSANSKDMLLKYNFNNDSYKSVSDRLYLEAYSTADDSFYFWQEDGSFYKISAKTGKSSNLDISTNSEKTEFEDMGNMKNIYTRFLVVDDETMVFYDKNMQAFRILTKNE